MILIGLVIIAALMVLAVPRIRRMAVGARGAPRSRTASAPDTGAVTS
jgi:hypothetical protein